MGKMAKEKLDVFLSSDQKEFSKLRNVLAKKLCNTPFLTCTLLENRGADPTNVIDASLKAVEKSDLYVGIFGRQYSETAINEYRKAVECRLPVFAYVKTARRREQKLSAFIENVLKNEFHYMSFHHRAELETQVSSDLERFILETIILGLEERKKMKDKTKELFKTEERVESKIPRTRDPLYSAKASLKQGNNLESLVVAAITLETNLRKALIDRNIPARSLRSFGDLIQHASNLQTLDKNDIESLRKISYYRNIAVHMGDTPNTQTTKWILDTAQTIMDRINLKKREN